MYGKAIEYLKYLHALEIAAGMNFKTAFDDLYARNELPLALGRDLCAAQRQEMRHAAIARRMLSALGYVELSDLMAMPAALNAGLKASLSEPWPDGMDAYALICFNHAMESRFADGGVQAFCANMRKFAAQSIENIYQRSLFLDWNDELLDTVARDEGWHVALDAYVMQIYARIHDGFDMPGLLATKVEVTHSPFIHVIKARQEFLRSL